MKDVIAPLIGWYHPCYQQAS